MLQSRAQTPLARQANLLRVSRNLSLSIEKRVAWTFSSSAVSQAARRDANCQQVNMGLNLNIHSGRGQYSFIGLPSGPLTANAPPPASASRSRPTSPFSPPSCRPAPGMGSCSREESRPASSWSRVWSLLAALKLGLSVAGPFSVLFRPFVWLFHSIEELPLLGNR